MRRALRTALVLAGALALLAGMASAVLIWRVSRAPWPLSFLQPRIEAALSQGGVPATVGTAELAWDAENHRLDLRAREVRIGARDDALGIDLPVVIARLDWWALARGTVQLRALEILAPRLRLARRADGTITLAVEREDGQTDEEPAAEAAGILTAAERIGRVEIRQANVILVDERLRRTWQVHGLDLDMQHAEEGPRAMLRATLDAGGAAVSVAADAQLNQRLDGLTAAIHIPALPGDAVSQFWPEGVADEARRWVMANISRGTAREVDTRLVGHWDANGFTLDDASGAFTFDDVTVRYVDTMPPVTAAGGTATFTPAGLRFAVSRGQLDTLSITRGDVNVPFARGARRIDVDAHVAGALASALGVLAHPPVAFGAAFGVAPSAVAGAASIRLGLGIPLGDRRRGRDLDLAVTGDLHHVAWPPIFRDWPITDGDLGFIFRDGRVWASGTAYAKGVPVSYTLRRRTGDGGSRAIDVSARVDQRGRKELGVSPGDWLTGPVDVQLKMFDAGGVDRLKLDVDLRDAGIELPSPALAKRVGAPASVAVRLDLAGGTVQAVEQFKLKVAHSLIIGHATRTADGASWRTIDAHADLASSEHATPGIATLRVRPAQSRHALTLSSTDAGALARQLGYQHLRRGRFEYDGTVALDRDGLPFDGRGRIVDFSVTESPVFLRLAALTSVVGFAEALRTNTLRFELLKADITQQHGVFTIVDGKLKGPVLKIKFGGTVDAAAGTIDLRGTLIPSYYGLNTGAKKIPLVGGALKLVTGEAIQAFDFRVRGRLGDPQVSVDKLTSMAPGALRDLLRFLQE